MNVINKVLRLWPEIGFFFSYLFKRNNIAHVAEIVFIVDTENNRRRKTGVITRVRSFSRIAVNINILLRVHSRNVATA